MNEVLNAPQQDRDLFRYTRGPRDATIILVGEAWGAEEAAAKVPFVGTSGKELDRILHDAGLSSDRILFANLISDRPPQNDFTHFLDPTPTKGKRNAAPTDFRGIYPKPALLAGYRNLHSLIARVDPLVVIAAGNWPLWALTDHAECKTSRGFKLPTGIAKWRGSQTFSLPLSDSTGLDASGAGGRTGDLSTFTGRIYPILPIIHPAAILREWGWRQITVRDLQRASNFVREANGNRTHRGWEPPANTFTLHTPTFDQILARLRIWREQADTLTREYKPERDQNGPSNRCSRDRAERRLASLSTAHSTKLRLACDLETSRRKFISVVGLADADVELCIGLFEQKLGETKNRFTLSQECQIWRELKLLLEHPNVEILGQNFIYDTEWLWRFYNIKALVAFDTMVAHHLLFPGTPKRLDYLASLYCSHFLYWKDESWDVDADVGEHTWKYNCKDLRATYEIAGVLQGVLYKNPEMQALYNERIEQWNLSRQLTLRGMNFDQKLQSKMRLELLEEANLISSWLLLAVPPKWRYTSTGKPWFDSSKGTADLFYTCLGFSPILHKKTKRPTTDDSALQELSNLPHTTWLEPLFTRLRHLRSLGVFTSNFLDAKVSSDGRMRSSFNTAHPETFRWSSNKNGFGEGLNGQNLPKGDKEVIPDAEDGASSNFFSTDDPDL